MSSKFSIAKKPIICRNDYLEILQKCRMNGFVKIITGIRRCGKSFLLTTLYRQFLLDDGVPASHIVTIDLDDDDMKPLRNPLRLSEYVRRKVRGGKHPYYVFIDEIQRSQKILPDDVDLTRIAPEDREDAYVTFYDVLNGLRKIPHVDLYVTGSNSKTLSKDIPTHFRDRGQQIHVRPLSFSEYLPVSGFAQDKAEAFARYLVWGGMPVAALESDDKDRSRYLKGLFEEVYVKDIRERYGIKDDSALLAVLDILSSDIGSLTNPHRIGNTMDSLLKLRVSDNTLKSYMDHLEDAFLFSKARRFEVKGRKYIDSPCKYYSADLGLRNARLNFRDTDSSHPMENAIYNELCLRGYNVDVGVVPIATRTNGVKETRQHEIDFVVNRGNDKIYIQSAKKLGSEEKAEQEKLPLKRSGDFFRKVIVTEGYSQPMADEDGIVHVGVIPFLLDRGILSDLMKG